MKSPVYIHDTEIRGELGHVRLDCHPSLSHGADYDAPTSDEMASSQATIASSLVQVLH